MSSLDQLEGNWACIAWESGCTASNTSQVAPHAKSGSKILENQTKKKKRQPVASSTADNLWIARYGTKELVAVRTVEAPMDSGYITITKGEKLTLSDQSQITLHDGRAIMEVRGSVPRFVKPLQKEMLLSGWVCAEDVRARAWDHQ